MSCTFKAELAKCLTKVNFFHACVCALVVRRKSASVSNFSVFLRVVNPITRCASFLHSFVGTSVPQTSYVKAIDVWMGVCTAFVFAALVEFTFVNYLWRKTSPSEHLDVVRFDAAANVGALASAVVGFEDIDAIDADETHEDEEEGHDEERGQDGDCVEMKLFDGERANLDDGKCQQRRLQRQDVAVDTRNHQRRTSTPTTSTGSSRKCCWHRRSNDESKKCNGRPGKNDNSNNKTSLIKIFIFSGSGWRSATNFGLRDDSSSSRSSRADRRSLPLSLSYSVRHFQRPLLDLLSRRGRQRRRSTVAAATSAGLLNVITMSPLFYSIRFLHD